jgi:NADPH:quinone reductase-like Zn-dependent oxidoreductase
MKALFFDQHGERDRLRYGDVPDPRVGPGEVRVAIRATALNHLDIWVRKGWPGLSLALPHIGGSDGAGEVVELGPGVTGVAIGDRVCIDPGISTRRDEWTRRGQDALSPGYQILGEHRPGTFADYVVVPQENLLAIPAEMTFADAAAPLLTGVTAWHMFLTAGRLQAGESVLVVGAGGGVNSMAIQIAKLAGATVYALTSGTVKIQKALALGADHAIDYRADPEWSKAIFALTGRRGVDVVVDNVGQATLRQSLRALAPGGRLLTVGNTSGYTFEMDVRLMFVKQIRWIGSTMGSHQEFRDLMRLVFAGRLRPVIDRVLPLREGVEAVRLLEEGRQFGKLVLEP